MKPILKFVTFALSCLAILPSGVSAAQRVSSVWAVQSGSTTIYLAGSLPFLRESDQPLPLPFGQAFKASSRVVFEVDPKESKDEAASQKVIKLGMFAEGGSIADSLSEETYKQLGDFLSSSGAPRAGMDQFRPWFAAIMISMTEMIKQGMRPDLGVGEVIEGWALEANKPISGLEGMMVEIDLLRGLPREAHEFMLKSTLDEVGDAEAMEKESQEYIAAWRSGDAGALAKLEAGEDSEWARLMSQKLTRDRGEKWLEKFEAALGGDQATMFVVGIGHLVGDGNLLEKLTAKGYSVVQLEAKAPKKRKRGEERQNGKKKKPALIPVVLHSVAPAC